VWLVQRLGHLRLNRLKVAGASTNVSTVRFGADRSMDSLATAALAVNAYYESEGHRRQAPLPACLSRRSARTGHSLVTKCNIEYVYAYATYKINHGFAPLVVFHRVVAAQFTSRHVR
jgi:hypothetical protein